MVDVSGVSTKTANYVWSKTFIPINSTRTAPHRTDSEAWAYGVESGPYDISKAPRDSPCQPIRTSS